MNRRKFLCGLTLGALAAPLAAEAQPAGKVWRIGVLLKLYPPNAQPPQALRQRLRDLGYIEGQNLVVDWRYQLGGSKTAKALGLTVPQSLLQRADEIIQ